MVFYVNSKENNSSQEIAFFLKKCILHHPGKWSELVFLCIGSDRVTGDCLGPYIGHQLLDRLDLQDIYVYGTLKDPVHALNLEKVSRMIRSIHPQSLVIAIDASLGQKKHLGYVTIAYYRYCKHSRCAGAADSADHPAVYGDLPGRYHHTRNPELYKLFDLFVDAFCIKAVFLKKSYCRA